MWQRKMMVNPALWSRVQVESGAANAQRAVAIGLMVLSVAGTYLGFTGGVMAWFPGMFALTMVWQGAVSYLQFVFVRNWFTPWYLFPLAMSVVPAVIGYHALLAPYLVSMLASWNVPHADVLAWMVILVASLLVDVVPEKLLVGNGGGQPQRGGPHAP